METPNLRIASYNIRKTRGLDQKRDPGRILDVINGLGADVVVLQEADHRFGSRRAALPRALIESQTDYAVAPLARTDHSLGWHGNAVLLKDGLQVDEVQQVDLPGLEPRGAAVVRLRGVIDVTLVATHLGLRRRDRRRQQAAICEALQDDNHTIIAGDLNEWSSRAGLEPFGQHLSLCAPGRSFPSRFPLAPLDRFAISDGLHVQDAGVEEAPLAKRASDHLPIWCDVAEARPPQPPA